MTRLYARCSALKISARAAGLSLYLMVNLIAAGIVVQQTGQAGYAGADEMLESHLCAGHLPLMTNVTPDIRC